MTSFSISENDSEEIQDLSNVEDLARELRVPIEEILIYYQAAIKALRPNARIKAFLPILAGREVKQIVLEKKFRLAMSHLQTDSKV